MEPELDNLHLLDHPLIQHKLVAVRDRSTKASEFRRLLGEIAGLMTFEVSRSFATREVDVCTPLEATRGWVLARPITLVPIIRAGIGMTEGVLALVPEARVGFLGIYRDESSLQPVAYYTRFPQDIAAGPVLLIDPMMATGGSACHAVSELKAKGCRDIQLLCLICAPEGVRRLRELHPGVIVHAAALDRELDGRGFIRPGLGDAGDRCFGT
ncbi:MAG: uracil phosphoribosyltransferase [Planctomycetota bacterium]